jgi:hypothetical protein
MLKASALAGDTPLAYFLTGFLARDGEAPLAARIVCGRPTTSLSRKQKRQKQQTVEN